MCWFPPRSPLCPLKSKLLQDSIALLKAAACKIFDLEEEEVQLWDYYSGQVYGSNALDEDQDALKTKVKDKNLLEGQEILIIEKVLLSENLRQRTCNFLCNACTALSA